MAKADSPVRLEAELMAAARSTGVRWHRSAAEQVEYWADIGRRGSDVLNPDSLLAVKAGSLKVVVETVETPPVDSSALFAKLDSERDSGELARHVSGSEVCYQACATHPGLLEQIRGDGRVVLGQFENGEFCPSGD